MKYEGLIIRPPSEAYSLLLQVTMGCSHNKCTFCPTYRDKKFRIKSREEILEDLAEASHYRRVRRVFLCDGDALIIPQPRLLDILASIRRSLPDTERASRLGQCMRHSMGIQRCLRRGNQRVDVAHHPVVARQRLGDV